MYMHECILMYTYIRMRLDCMQVYVIFIGMKIIIRSQTQIHICLRLCIPTLRLQVFCWPITLRIFSGSPLHCPAMEATEVTSVISHESTFSSVRKDPQDDSKNTQQGTVCCTLSPRWPV